MKQTRNSWMLVNSNHPDKMHTCTICGVNVKQLFNLVSHVKNVHKLYLRNVCKYCPTKDDRRGRKFSLAYNTQDSMKQTHTPRSRRDTALETNHPDKMHTCTICGVNMTRLYNLVSHVKTVHKKYLRNVCKYCPTKDDRRGRTKRLITNHPYNIHMCVAHACTYTTRLLGDLRRHALNIHNSITNKICTYCSHGYTHRETRKPEADVYTTGEIIKPDGKKPEADVYTDGETIKPDGKKPDADVYIYEKKTEADDGYNTKTSYKCATPYCTFTTKYNANLRRHKCIIHNSTNNKNKTKQNVYKNSSQENTQVQTTVKKVDSNRFYIELVIFNNK